MIFDRTSSSRAISVFTPRKLVTVAMITGGRRSFQSINFHSNVNYHKESCNGFQYGGCIKRHEHGPYSHTDDRITESTAALYKTSRKGHQCSQYIHFIYIPFLIKVPYDSVLPFHPGLPSLPEEPFHKSQILRSEYQSLLLPPFQLQP